MKRLACLLAAALALCTAPLAAHDMWIEPATFSPATGDIVSVRLRVGQDFLGDPLPRDPSLINQFVVRDSEGLKPVVGRAGSDPAGFLRAATPGVLVVGYRSNPSAVNLAGEKFNQYLKEEGLEGVAAERARRGQTGATRELFSRCAKSLILSGSAGDASGAKKINGVGAVGPASSVRNISKDRGDEALGFTLELVAERNPYALAAGDELPVRLTYEGRPLAGALVVAMNRANPTEKIAVRSDKDGRVRLRLSRAGTWLVKAVHMVEAPAGAHAEWASYWASLTFALGQPAASGRPS